MKTDRFNEAVRRKLEGIEPPFQEQEWSKFQAFYKQQMPATWWVRTGAKWVGYGATGLVATILVVTNIIQYRENRILRQTVTELRREIQVVRSTAARASVAPGNAASSSQSPLTATNGKTIHPADNRPDLTGDGQVTAETRPDYAAGPAQHADLRFSDQTRQSTYGNRVASEGEGAGQTATRSLRSGEKFSESVETAGNGLRGDRYATPAGTKNANSRETENVLSSGETRSGETRSGETRSGGTRFAGTDTKPGPSGYASGNLPENRSVSVSEGRKITEVAYLRPHTGFDVYPEGIPVKTAIPVKRRFFAAPAAESPSIRLPKTRTTAFRVGGGFEWEKNYAAKSVSVGVILGKHWGINSGLTIAKVNGESYVSERKFIDKNHRDFRMNHAPKVPPNFKIININTESDMIRIPLNITYRTNLPDNWAFLTSAGTMIDVKVDQQYKFNVIRNPFTGEFSADKTTFQPREPLINSFNAGVGLEKRFAHLAFQVETYLAPSLRNCDYRLEKTPAGLRIRALYEF